MSVNTATEALRTQFSDMIHMNLANTTSRLRSKLKFIRPQSGNVALWDSLDGVSSYEITGRNEKTKAVDANHSRRRMVSRRFASAILLDPKDELESIVDPTSPYAERIAQALMARFDTLVVAAALAPVTIGTDTLTVRTASADGVKVVDATAGLTYDKLLEIQENFINAGVDMESEDIYMTATGKENTAMMKETKLTSGDFVRDLVVEKGRITKAAGIQPIFFPANAKNGDVMPASGGVRSLIAFTSGAVAVGMGKDITVRISERDDLNYSKQIFAEMIVSFVRTEGALVQQVNVAA